MTGPAATTDHAARYTDVPVLVLGGAGFVGQWVAKALARAGAVVHVVSRDAARAARVLERRQVDARVIGGDLASSGVATDIVGRVRPAVVFNLAVHGVDPTERDADAMMQINTAVVAELCEAMAAGPAAGWSGLSLVQAGSALEYGAVQGSVAEDVPPNPTTAYGRTKLAATERVSRAASATGLTAVVARLFTVYGPGEHSGRLLPDLLRAAATGGRVPLSAGHQRRDFTYVEDVAEALVRLGASSPGPQVVINVATGRLTSVRSFVETAADVLGINRGALDFGALPTRTEEMWHDDVDLSRLRRQIAWVPSTTVADGIRRTREWIHAE